ncbi:hypothetical protein Scep_012016 [Stephania cephalantha]|uniref:Uncharacterized protein n=1 Tax=Stephania cephalantha TaxID=152367 RepID=A0AAP0P6D5_9MAGN
MAIPPLDPTDGRKHHSLNLPPHRLAITPLSTIDSFVSCNIITSGLNLPMVSLITRLLLASPAPRTFHEMILID